VAPLIREQWGFGDDDGPTLAGLFRQQYRGSRCSWGYPACPDREICYMKKAR